MLPKFVKTALFFILVLSAAFVSCKQKGEKKTMSFKDYPDLKIGFTTQNFQKAMPLGLDNLLEIISFASNEGYQFIEIRDDLARLTVEECKVLADEAKKKNLEVIYEVQKNPLDTGFIRIFNKALENAKMFPDPGILRVMISKSEYVPDPQKKGWTLQEINTLSGLVDSCATIAGSAGMQLLVENSDESFFGNGPEYYGLTDFFEKTVRTGFQFDISNPFRKSSRVRSDPDKVMDYMSQLSSRWVSSHIKTIKFTGGEMQPVLTENPLPVERVIKLMGEMNVTYVALELLAVEDKDQCFRNHSQSILFLRNKGVLN